MITSNARPRKLTLGKFNVRAEDVWLTPERIEQASYRYIGRFSRPSWVRRVVRGYQFMEARIRKIFRAAIRIDGGRD